MPRITPEAARETLTRLGCGAAPDFFTLSSSDVEAVLTEADKAKYRKPQTANGSRARYFYQYLTRTAKKG